MQTPVQQLNFSTPAVDKKMGGSSNTIFGGNVVVVNYVVGWVVLLLLRSYSRTR